MDMLQHKLLILDMDGVIINSEPVHREVYSRIAVQCAQGKALSVKNVPGSSSVQVYQTLLDACPPSEFTAQELSHRHYRDVWNALNKKGAVVPMPGLRELLAAVRNTDGLYAVASCSPRWFVEACLKGVGIWNEAAFVIAGDCGLPVKPAPDLFLSVLHATGVRAEDAIVVEDSCAGTLAAARAGIRCIGLINPDTGKENLSAAAWQVDSLYAAAELYKTAC